jgi:hypothetical protein
MATVLELFLALTVLGHKIFSTDAIRNPRAAGSTVGNQRVYPIGDGHGRPVRLVRP